MVSMRKVMMFNYSTVVVAATLLLLAMPKATATNGGYVVYVDSVRVSQGEDVSVAVNVSSISPLSSISIPITYDTSVVSLLSISFAGSLAEHLATKIVNPAEITQVS